MVASLGHLLQRAILTRRAITHPSTTTASTQFRPHYWHVRAITNGLVIHPIPAGTSANSAAAQPTALAWSSGRTAPRGRGVGPTGCDVWRARYVSAIGVFATNVVALEKSYFQP